MVDFRQPGITALRQTNRPWIGKDERRVRTCNLKLWLI